MTTHTYDIAHLAPEFLFASHVGTLARVRTSWEVVERDAREFDAIDTKGRRFGALARIKLESREPSTEGYRTSRWLGQQYCLEVQALRDGTSYGSSGNSTYHPTLEAAQAAAAKYFIGAEKRALTNKSRKA